MQRTVSGILHADDAGKVSRSTEELARVMVVIEVACQEFGLMVSESRTKSMRL